MLVYRFCWRFHLISNSLWKHAHGQRWPADKMRGTLDLNREVGVEMTWVHRLSRKLLQPKNVNSPNKSWYLLITTPIVCKSRCWSLYNTSRTSFDLRSAVLTWSLTYWFVVTQYASVEVRLVLSINDRHVWAWCSSWVLISYTLGHFCDSGQSPHRSGSQAMDNNNGFIFKEMEKRWDRLQVSVWYEAI